MKNNIKIIILLVVIVSLSFLLSYYSNKNKEIINPDNLSFNETKLNELKYHINVDCKLLIEGDKNNLMFADDIRVGNSSMKEICLGVFPDLKLKGDEK